MTEFSCQGRQTSEDGGATRIIGNTPRPDMTRLEETNKAVPATPAVLLTRQEFADRMKVSTRTVARWEELGMLRAYKISGGIIRYRESDIETMLNAAGE